LPKSSIPTHKIKVDRKNRFRYQVGYWLRLIDASICWAKANADTQFEILDSSAPEKQLLIFYLYLSKGRVWLKTSNKTDMNMNSIKH